ncbi:MAG: cobalamin biosynthesis bifunctional protein CbiET, partial [Opitutae bacterium]|nr:cobalamin biosynthesis bifunctional protein CbiET [Opitutae bacterium]
MKSHPVEVIGCSGEAQAVLDGIEFLFGSKRLLAAVGPALPPGCECVELGADLAETLRIRLAERGGRRTAVLASGDPLYCGIGGTLR